jgi:ornithine carbamoyltransferase
MAKRGGAKEGLEVHALSVATSGGGQRPGLLQPALAGFSPEAENRLWAAISALEGFVVNKRKIVE